MDNKKVYCTEATVSEYFSHDYILKSEQVILDFLKNSDHRSKMLDIGVGAGRTTKYFAPLFESYTGIDYSAEMIAACKQKYVQSHYEFVHANACSLDKMPDNSFDFVLFSFNGIDCVSKEERVLVLKEVYRVLKVGGFFAFSIHNSYYIPGLLSFQFSKNPFRWPGIIKKCRRIANANPDRGTLLNNDFADVIDGDLDFQTSYVYAKPEAQIKQLEVIGLKTTQVISMRGIQLNINVVNWKQVKDPWLYFVCVK